METHRAEAAAWRRAFSEEMQLQAPELRRRTPEADTGAPSRWPQPQLPAHLLMGRSCPGSPHTRALGP